MYLNCSKSSFIKIVRFLYPFLSLVFDVSLYISILYIYIYYVSIYIIIYIFILKIINSLVLALDIIRIPHMGNFSLLNVLL